MAQFITYVVGEGGKILTRDDNQGLFIDKSFQDNDWMDVQSFKTDPAHAIVCGSDYNSNGSGIIYTTDGGNKWINSAHDPFHLKMSYKVWITEDDTVWISSDEKIVRKSIDGGANFVELYIPTTEPTIKHIRAIHALDVNRCIVGVSSIHGTLCGSVTFNQLDYMEVWITTDGGATWNMICDKTAFADSQRFDRNAIVGIHMTQNMQQIVVQTMYEVYVSNDGGNTFTNIFQYPNDSDYMRKLSWYPAYGTKDKFFFHSYAMSSGFCIKTNDLNNFLPVVSGPSIRSADANLFTQTDGYFLGEGTY